MNDDSDYWDLSEYEKQDYDENVEPTTFYQTYKLCVEPSLIEIYPHLFNLLAVNFIFKVTIQIRLFPHDFNHIFSGMYGLAVLYLILQTSLVYIIVFIIFCFITIYTVQYFSCNNWPYWLSCSCFIYLIISEFYFPIYEAWRENRGLHMVVAMKAISLGFDIKKGVIQPIPNIIEYIGYMLCPSNCLFGPWISFNTYKSIFKQNTSIIDIKWAQQVLFTTSLAILFLILSNCWEQWFNWKWFVAYQEAFSFRSSHYFISYLSEAAMITSGFNYERNGKRNGRYIITRPFDIELPRSLVQVVVSWNIPMHMWLRNYVFQVCKPLGKFFAIIMTYLISSFLHGFNLRLASVLLSLGFYTYVEYVLRQKLCSIFDACIGANRCKKCEHVYHNDRLYVRLVNGVFSCIAIFHLAYLGCLMETTSQSETESFLKWKRLDYISHILTLIMYTIYKLI